MTLSPEEGGFGNVGFGSAVLCFLLDRSASIRLGDGFDLKWYFAADELFHRVGVWLSLSDQTGVLWA